MSTLLLEHEPEAASLKVTADAFIVELSDGRSLSIPWTWYPRLLHGTEAERQNWRLLGDGYAIEWPDLDEHIGIEGLVAGRRSGESDASLKQWFTNRTRSASSL